MKARGRTIASPHAWGSLGMEMILPLPHWHAPTPRHVHFISWPSTNQRSRTIESLLFRVGVCHEMLLNSGAPLAGSLPRPSTNLSSSLLGHVCKIAVSRGPNSEPSSRVNRMGSMLLWARADMPLYTALVPNQRWFSWRSKGNIDDTTTPVQCSVYACMVLASQGRRRRTDSRSCVCACLYLKHAQEHSSTSRPTRPPLSLAFGVVGVRHRLPVLAISHA
ncbi:hypothetical protein J3F84DRAFT_6476 [Trichoderma pleuroticola]